MYSKEDEKTPCKKCNGEGQVGELTYCDTLYKIVCPHCRGVRQLDWIEQIIRPSDYNFMDNKPGIDALTIVLGLKVYMPPDNYVFVFGGTTYFVMKDHFDMTRSTDDRWSSVVMNVPFMKENPGTLDMWKD